MKVPYSTTTSWGVTALNSCANSTRRAQRGFRGSRTRSGEISYRPIGGRSRAVGHAALLLDLSWTLAAPSLTLEIKLNLALLPQTAEMWTTPRQIW